MNKFAKKLSLPVTKTTRNNFHTLKTGSMSFGDIKTVIDEAEKLGLDILHDTGG